MGERYFNFSLADTNKQLREVNELAAKKVAEFQDFSSKVERVVEYNEILLCTIAGLIVENERLKKALKLIQSKSELPEEPVDLVPITELYEINLHAKEALR
ncbi:hypothetical protein EI976_05485 [Bacillus licheniformis]|uniref:hypothetical protein n=1 Tax=Bacillus licheniformis TaxID=1402 RepID=UPI000310B060|nr:hypothetical protein [Bacillus licheniformis]KAA0813061.1 hypothetical protein EI978_07830 [Bacillus licheniformis]KAA0821249.1 hypothetical protein EI973_18835 [Bacillus licheniformis]KAA0826491.1 hypothetical protein EI976_05485 [Bacillus licheniformis]MBU8781602.1 hypothetical protein [Bacillus licheniformis]MBU8799452.1 hypothetical protein [Bacillus licheniformis]